MPKVSKKVERPVVTCKDCNKVKGRYAKDWGTCRVCRVTLCLSCKPSRSTLPCRECGRKEYEAEKAVYMEKVRLERSRPRPCSKCGCVTSPEELEADPSKDSCHRCRERDRLERERLREKNKRQGHIEVAYGEYAVTPTAGGYAYDRAGFDVKVGDVVTVPGNWLHPGVSRATVVALGSTYTGEVSRITGVVSK
jgi:hypothetical protein